MEEALDTKQSPAEQDRRISEAFEREQPRLRSFIRRRVADSRDAEDILQEVFTELVEAYRMFQTIDQAGAWLFRVARNRIVDLFRKKKPVPFSELASQLDEEGEEMSVEDLLPSPEAGPEAAFARLMLVEELEEALDELPTEQRETFVAHEIEGISFKELADWDGSQHAAHAQTARGLVSARKVKRHLPGISEVAAAKTYCSDGAAAPKVKGIHRLDPGSHASRSCPEGVKT